MIDDLLGGVVGAIVEKGADELRSDDSSPKIDLTPLVNAIEELKGQGAEVLSALTNPTRTAGDELCDRAVTAFANGWYSDALRDARASVDAYPYRARPRLVGALAAVALGDGHQALELLDSAVKYAPNGEPEVGAIAGLLGADLAVAVGAHRFAVDLLERADKLMNGRFPALVAVLVRIVGLQSDHGTRLKQLWWDEHGGHLDSRTTACGLALP